ncbi:hypothetical protein [Echinicola sp. 20G]|nr:hypothetical protein [Echinicola sp. 20G]
MILIKKKRGEFSPLFLVVELAVRGSNSFLEEMGMLEKLMIWEKLGEESL